MTGVDIFVHERFVASKAADRQSQDVIFASRAFAAVIDGATTTVPCECCGHEAGRLAATNVASTLDSLDEGADLTTALVAVQKQLIVATSTLPCRGEAWAASMALVSANQRQLWMIGDVQVLLDGNSLSNTKRVDQVAAAMRAATIHCALAADADLESIRADDVGRKAIQHLLRAQIVFRNNPDAGSYAFAALATSPTPIALCTVVALDHHQHEIVLATDGYLTVLDTLAETEAELAKVLDHDPLLIHEHPQTKGVSPNAASFDDRAYLRLVLPRLAPT